MAIDFTTPIESYHASSLVSHSKLGDFASRGAAYYHALHVARTEKRDPPSDAMVFGQLFEDSIQRPEQVEANYVVRPEGLDLRTKDGKAWKDSAAGKSIISADDHATIMAMRQSTSENRTAVDMIRVCKQQPTITFEHLDVPRIPGLQARPDWISMDGCAYTGFRPFVLDLKTTSDLARLASGRAVTDYKYHSQFAMTRFGLCANGIDDAAYYLLAVEKQRPHRCQVIEVTAPWLDAGERWCMATLRKLEQHYARNEWPRVDAEAIELPAPPPWVDAA
jgi:hypothetical protein